METAAAKLLQSCPSLCDPRDDSPRGSPVPGILQARTLNRSQLWKEDLYQVEGAKETTQHKQQHPEALLH